MSKLQIKATPVLNKLIQSKSRFVLSVGSSRSSKTYSMMQWIIVECGKRRGEGIYISVVRASFPSLRRTVYREFVDLLKEMNLYDENKHNKTEHVIELFGNYIEFFSLNDSQKVRGAKRNILYLNEVNEIDWESAQQLFLRTTERVFMDENPSDIWHWSMKMKERDDCEYLHCFTGHMRVLTNEGYRRIDDISIGDLVMTRAGYKRVVRVYNNGLSNVIDYKIGDTNIQCTPGHKFWSDEYGFKEISLLPSKTTFSTYDNINNIWLNQELNITELSSQNTQVKNTMSLVARLLETNLCDFIDIDGLEKKEKSLKDMRSITSMETNSIIGSRTSKCSQKKNIGVNQHQREQLSQSKRDSNGLDQTLVENQSQSGLEKQTKKSQDIQNVNVGKLSYKQIYTPIESSAQKGVAQELICEGREKRKEKGNVNTVSQNSLVLDQRLSIAPSNVKVPVFDLEVEDNHEYIVEGILVSNSTYKDNPFLTEATIKQIESYKDVDENFYRVYALGLPGYSITTIYTHFQEYNDKELYVKVDDKPQPIYDDFCYGLDVGYGHAMVLTKCYFKDDTVWIEEVIYRSGLTSNDLISLMKSENINPDKDIWVDAAAPAMVEDLRRAGYNAKSADKSVKEGIDMIKSKKVFINETSTNLINEVRRYSWKTKGEQIIYEPVKVNDDGCDSFRYAIWNYYRTTKRIEENDIDIEIFGL